jgi:RNA polymerase sigma-70 factor (ECF subfamily)
MRAIMIDSLPAIEEQPAALFDLYAASLYRFALVLLHHQADAEDVVQTAFLRLMQHLARGGDRTHLRAWLFTVTANLARDRLRARRRWVRWDLSIASPAVSGPELDVRDPQQQFLDAAQRLAPRDRLLLALRAQGLSYREIAQAAGVRPSSVGQLLARAVARWRRAREATAIS